MANLCGSMWTGAGCSKDGAGNNPGLVRRRAERFARGHEGVGRSTFKSALQIFANFLNRLQRTPTPIVIKFPYGKEAQEIWR